jgi:2-polyprenyl-6-methoxyphenol hydroxylase-like FAD-dependent oxidoreductase
VTALALGAAGHRVRVYESANEIRPLGVGINVLPHAMGVLADLGLLDELMALGVATGELAYFNRHGQLIWREPRGRDAGYEVPQLSVHRGAFQLTLLDTVAKRLGADVVVPGFRLVSFDGDERGVRATFHNRTADARVVVGGDVLVGADGIHSVARAQLFPEEGAPLWSGNVLWRATCEGPAFLTGRSMVMIGTRPHKFVAYPIGAPASDGHTTINWVAELDRSGEPLASREDWNRLGDMREFLPRFEDWRFPWLDVPGLIRGASAVYEFPMVDRDPLPRWTFGRVTLLGDAAHPMYPIGSNGASQAILDAAALARSMSEEATLEAALARYEAERLPATASIVRANRRHGPERVLDLAEERAPGGFADPSDVFAPGELEAIAAAYKQVAGFTPRSR